MMFKGESDLDVFQNSNALKMLVETFSDVKDFEAYFEFMEYATKKADQARDNAQKLDRKNTDRIKLLNRTIEFETATLNDIEREIKNKENEAVNFNSLLKSIEQSKNVPFERVLFALGIRLVGKVVAKQLANHFTTMDKIVHASIDELTSVEGVGRGIAESIINYMSKPENINLIEKLKLAGLQMEAQKTKELSQKLAGKNIIISGTFKYFSRDQYKQMIETHGGKNVSSLSNKTSYMLAGEHVGPAKFQKAQQLDIPIIDELKFLEFLDIDIPKENVQMDLFS
jgi:NAD-dependent DNA ligase